MKFLVNLVVWLNLFALWLMPVSVGAAVLWGIGVPQQGAFIIAGIIGIAIVLWRLA